MTHNEKILASALLGVLFTAGAIIGLRDAEIKELKTENAALRRRNKTWVTSLTKLLKDPDFRVSKKAANELLIDLKFEEQIMNF